jgi:hypothetical protein
MIRGFEIRDGQPVAASDPGKSIPHSDHMHGRRSDGGRR